jgi:hypothetical protein
MIRWHIGKPFIFNPERQIWKTAVRRLGYIYALLVLTQFLHELKAAQRWPIQVVGLLVLWLLARRDLRNKPPKWHYHRKVL